MSVEQPQVPLEPRGTRRIVYCSDPSSIVLNLLPNPVEPEDLRGWVDMLADSGVDTLLQDVYNQGYTVYWRSDRLQYDPREQHRPFLPMLDAGIQPLRVLIDRSHERGMSFLAGFRMNDNHAFPVYANFIESHPEWQLTKFNEAAGHYVSGKTLDFTFDEVRDFVFEVMREVVTRFDVDGLEMTFREFGYFPFPEGRKRAHLMTDLVRRVRGFLDERSESGGTRILLGARVYPSLEESLDNGLDVRTWVAEGLTDYLSPGDTMFSDFNAPYAEFADLTRSSRCMLYPGLYPWTSQGMRMREQAEKRIALTPSIQRALAQTFYGAGADGISFYNHFMQLWLPPFYPQTLQVFHELRDPQRVACGERHYIFEPTLDDGEIAARMVVLDRGAAKPSGILPLRLYEQMDRVRGIILFLRGAGLTGKDDLEVRLNGTSNVPEPMGKAAGWGGDWAIRKYPEVRWFRVPPEAVARGENELGITLVSGDPQASGQIVIDQVELWVQPK